MILLTQDYMLNQLDYEVKTLNSDVLFKEYWYKICGYIYKVSVYNFTPNDVDEIINTGKCKRCDFTSIIADKDDREFLFKRAMGLQLIYDNTNGRNEMIKGSNENDDFCREAREVLDIIGLIPKYRSC